MCWFYKTKIEKTTKVKRTQNEIKFPEMIVRWNDRKMKQNLGEMILSLYIKWKITNQTKIIYDIL